MVVLVWAVWGRVVLGCFRVFGLDKGAGFDEALLVVGRLDVAGGGLLLL